MDDGNCRWVEREAVDGWFPYARDHALAAGNTLGEIIKQSLEHDRWRSSTCVPALAKPSQLERYRESVIGGPNSHPIVGPDGHEWISERINQCLRGRAATTLIIPDAMARVGDPHLDKFWSDYVTYNEEVYLVLSGDQASPTRVRQALRAAGNPWMEVAMITTAPILNKQLTSKDLEIIAGLTIAIAATAYDGETWLLVEPGP